MLELTQQQLQALTTSEETPPIVLDPATKQTYVLVRRDLYDRLKSMVDEDDARQMAPLLAELDPEDWEDLSAYEKQP